MSVWNDGGQGASVFCIMDGVYYYSDQDCGLVCRLVAAAEQQGTKTWSMQVNALVNNKTCNKNVVPRVAEKTCNACYNTKNYRQQVASIHTRTYRVLQRRVAALNIHIHAKTNVQCIFAFFLQLIFTHTKHIVIHMRSLCLAAIHQDQYLVKHNNM